MNTGSRMLPRLRHPASQHRGQTQQSTASEASYSTSSLESQLFPATEAVELPQSRGTLTYATYGKRSGFPVIYLHGYPGSRLEPVLIQHLARQRNLYLIAPDRPGFGRSTAQPGRTIADYPADLRALAQHLGLRRYAVLGGSGGGPYAVACAHRDFGLPREEMRAVGVLAGAPTWEAGTQEVTWDRKVLGWMSRSMPTTLRIGADALMWMVRWLFETTYVKRRIEEWMGALSQKEKEKRSAEKARKIANGEDVEADEGNDPDRPDWTPAEKREMLVAPLLEGFAQGAGGAVEEARLLTQPWGFRFEDVDHDKVIVWHGAKDTNAPISMVRWMAERIPHCDLKEFPDDSHYTIGSKLGQALDELVTDEVRNDGVSNS